MIETTIKDALNKDIITKRIFNGVYARNELPTKIKYPAAIVFNSKPRDHPGEHWLAIYFDEQKNAYFFDSYGDSPQKFQMVEYLKKMSRNYIWNKKRIQGYSTHCGYYCLLFLFLISRKKLNVFFKYFTNNFLLNDLKVDKLIKNFKN